ncbi:MAG TPA: DegT/DnrJ/EryC1/StrS family aminotransferase [Stellaceae bacterium]|nr:DegT/DnrJ/EryC1/StrS family aminotransferase [Stellaceae bacterium]
MFYELAADTWGAEERAAMQRVLDSGRFTMGPEVARFEESFAGYFGRRYAVMANSGSSANLIAVASFFYKKDRPLRRGDEAIVPAIAWSTTYHPLHQYGLKLRIIDVDLATLNADVEALEAALTPQTRLVVGVSILGNPAPLDVMRRFADRHGLYFMEDNCESMDAELAGQKTGAFGDVASFSTFFSHHLSTMEGGIVLTDDRELFELSRALRAHGWTRDLPADSVLYERSPDDFVEAYRFLVPGYNLRPLEITAAIGSAQLPKLPAMTTMRRRNWQLFTALFAGDERFIIQREHGKSSAFSFTIVLDPKRSPDRRRVLAALKDADIGYRVITGGCITRHDVARHYDYTTVGALPNANAAHDLGFFVGNHPFDLRPQIERLHHVLDRACN